MVVYKGPDTLVAAPDGRLGFAPPAPAWLASAGTGDVLAGMIAALRARGHASFEAACAGVWLHGRAAEIAGPAMIADDLAAAIPHALALLDDRADRPHRRARRRRDARAAAMSPFAVPGDRLLDDGTIEPGPHHQVPPCRHFPECGGCQLQHVDDAAYRDYLVARVAGALAQHGLETEIREPHLSPPHSRRRASCGRSSRRRAW